MNRLCNFIAILAAVVSLALATVGCTDKKEEPRAPEELNIDAQYKTVEVDMGESTIEIPVQTNLSLQEWTVSYDVPWISAQKMETADKAPYIELKFKANPAKDKRTGTVTVKSVSKLHTRTIAVTQLGEGQVAVEGDVRVKPVGAVASDWEKGYANQGIDMTLDGDYASHYHSPWSNTRFPVTLEYKFAGTEPVDYIIYYPRNGNGNFGKFTLYVATDAARTYEKVADYDFFGKDGPSKVSLPGSRKVTGIKFEVKSGSNNLASCAEMEFYRSVANGTLNNQLLTVFTDLSCSALRTGVTSQQVEALPEYFARVARTLQAGGYDAAEADFRIRSYEPYSIPAVWSEKFMTNIYSSLDNPTGITVKAGDEIIVCVGPTNGYNVSLQCLGEERVKHEKGDYWQPAESGTTYMLREGVNKLNITSPGQLFMMYNVPDILAADAKPITVHFPPGKAVVNGFFDLATHKTNERYAQIIARATDKYFCVKGERTILYFHRTKLPATQIVGAIQLWDDMCRWEQEFCGVEDYRGEGKPFNNHLFSMSPEANNGQLFFWSSQHRMAYIYTALGDVVIDRDQALLRPGRTWGPAHEMGHFHQDAINWNSSTETSANIFAHYVNERLGKYTSHGPGLRQLANQRVKAGSSWYDICAGAGSINNNVNNRMWWQLYIYYSKVLGRNDFYKKVFNIMREKKLNAYTAPARKQLEFAKACSTAAGENLTDFFELWGFFVPVNATAEVNNMNVTQPMIDDARKHMEQYPRPKHAFEYIEDRKMSGYLDGDFDRADIGDLGFFETYRKNAPLNPAIAATVSGRHVAVTNGNEAVAIEVRQGDETGKLIYFNNFLNFDIPTGADLTNCALFAVQANGERKLLGRF